MSSRTCRRLLAALPTGLLLLTLASVSALTFAAAGWLGAAQENARLRELLASLEAGNASYKGPGDNPPSAATPRARPTEAARDAALERSRDAQRAIDAILATPPPVPGNACESARILMEEWLRRRKSQQ